MNRYWRATIGIAFVSAVSSFPVVAAEAAVPCKRTCKDSVVVNEQTVKWRSPELFRSEAGVTGLGVEVRLGRKPLLETESLSGCAWYAYRRGITARISTCGDPARAVVSVSSVRAKTVRVRVLYRSFF